jgi:hypothetical protein
MLPASQPIDGNGRTIGWTGVGTLSSATLQNAAALTGGGTVLSVSGMATATFTAATTGFSGTVLFQGSADGVIYTNLLARATGTTVVATGTGALTTDTSNSIWIADIAGLAYIKAPITRSAGSITITATASPMAANIGVGTVFAVVSNGAVAAGTTTAAGVIKAAPGFLSGALVTALGTAAISIYDHASAASGTVIGYVPANTAAGTFVPFNMPALLGITAGKVNNSPALTVAYS